MTAPMWCDGCQDSAPFNATKCPFIIVCTRCGHERIDRNRPSRKETSK